MNACKGVKRRGAAGIALRKAHRMADHTGRKTPSRSYGAASLRVWSARHISLRDPPAPSALPVDSHRSPAPLRTASGLDLRAGLTRLIWRAHERGYVNWEMVHELFPSEQLTPDALAEVYRALEEAGVEVRGARPAEPAAAPPQESLHVTIQSASSQLNTQQTGDVEALPPDTAAALVQRLEEADQEMRQILYSFGFAAREHLARAERLLAQGSEKPVKEQVADSGMSSGRDYLQSLPALIRQVRALDQKAAAAYRKWREAQSRSRGDKNWAGSKMLDYRLQQAFPKFRYRTKVMEEMARLAQSIAARFRASLRVLQPSQRSLGSVCQLPLVDVERQTIAALEELVRMPGDVFLRRCLQLTAAEARFQQARADLIQGHLHLVASLAATYAHRGLSAPVLIRAGVGGLVRAVERFGFRHGWRFSTYAACWIRQAMHDALAARRRKKSLRQEGANQAVWRRKAAYRGARP